MSVLVKIALSLAVAYLAAVAVAWVIQDRMLFPTALAAKAGTPLPPDTPRLALTLPGGDVLRGVRLTPPALPMTDRVVILGFAGNAWNAEDAAAYLYTLYPQAEVIVYHYRGYAPSTGRPSVDALLADAPIVFDNVREEAKDARIVAAGFSIGSGVAVHLARERKLDGMILVTPFDSLAELAAHHFPWLPTASLIRNPMRNGDLLRGLDVPTAIIAAERDDVVPRERTSEMRGAAKRMVYSRTIKDANHNDLYEREDFAIAMREALSALEITWQEP